MVGSTPVCSSYLQRLTCIFHFQEDRGRAEPPDGLTIGLSVDDANLNDIIRDLYYPDSPYAFSKISEEILGHVYEHF